MIAPMAVERMRNQPEERDNQPLLASIRCTGAIQGLTKHSWRGSSTPLYLHQYERTIVLIPADTWESKALSDNQNRL